MAQQPPPLTIRLKKLLIALLISLSVLGVLAVSITVFYHPVMVRLAHGDWCADVNSVGKVQAVHYGAVDCDMSSYR